MPTLQEVLEQLDWYGKAFSLLHDCDDEEDYAWIHDSLEDASDPDTLRKE